MTDQLTTGEQYFARGEIEAARQCFAAFLDNHPGDPAALNNLGVIAYRGNRREEAERFFREAVETGGDYPEALLNLANLYQNAENWPGAADCLERAIRAGGQPKPVADQLAAVYAKMGKTGPGGRVAEDTAQVPPSQAYPKLAMARQQLRNVLEQTGYYPHPEVRRGQLQLDNEVFESDDRETNVIISPGVRIDLTGDVRIGAWTMMGAGTVILTHDHYHGGRDVPLLKVQEKRGVSVKNKVIGRDVWLHQCTVLYQVTEIPDGVVVGAGSVLTKIPGPYEIWAGNPARKIGER